MKRILVVVDMQNDFTTGPLGNAECAAVIPKVAEVIKTGVYDRLIINRKGNDPVCIIFSRRASCKWFGRFETIVLEILRDIMRFEGR